MCNACGLYLKLHGRPRPMTLKNKAIKSRNRTKTPRAQAVNGTDGQTAPTILSAAHTALTDTGMDASPFEQAPAFPTAEPGDHQAEHQMNGFSTSGLRESGDAPLQVPPGFEHVSFPPETDAPVLSDFAEPGTGAPLPLNNGYGANHDPMPSYSALQLENGHFRTRVSELEVIQELFRGRVEELERNEQDTQQAGIQRDAEIQRLRADLETANGTIARLQNILDERNDHPDARSRKRLRSSATDQSHDYDPSGIAD